MNSKVYVSVGFWKRLIARLIDLLIVSILSIGLLTLFTKRENNIYVFKEYYYFYIWASFTFLMIFIFVILIPIKTQGYSIGFWLIKIKVESKDGNYIKAICMREMYYGFVWMFIVFLVATVINHTLIIQIADIKNNINGDKNLAKNLSILSKVRISFVGSVTSILSFVQLFVGVTIVANKNKEGAHDRAANAIVISPKMTKEVEDKFNQNLKPRKFIDGKVEWV